MTGEMSRRRVLGAAGAGAGLATVSGVVGSPARAATAGRAAVTDVIHLGDRDSERRHAVSGNGAATAVSGAVEAGQLTEPYRAWRLGAGGRLRGRRAHRGAFEMRGRRV